MDTKILICDDLKEGCDNATSKLQQVDNVDDVTPLYGDDLRRALEAVFKVTAELLQGDNPKAEEPEIPPELRKIDLAIVDNNLAELAFGGARLTAEGIIGYLRAFTDIPFFVSLNKNPHVDFDLKYLLGDHESIADLALNTSHLAKSRLWGDHSGDDFAPWYWPRLPDAAKRRKQQFTFVSENLDAPLWDALGFPSEAIDYLSRRAKGGLAPESSEEHDLRTVTFGQCFQVNRSLPPKARDTLLDFAGDGIPWARDAISRIAAAEIDRWIRKDILAPQEVLIDVPHLLSRMPFLLGQNASQLEKWNSAIAETGPPFGLDQELHEQHVSDTEFRASCWVPSPCFWWPKLKSDGELSRLFFESEENWPDAAFCEDISAFVAIEPDNPPAPTEFLADIEGSWPRRYIARQTRTSLNFSPRSRIIG